MLITEAQMSMKSSINPFSVLENMQYLSEAESVYAPAMVPIVENQSLQANIIPLESMTEFCESNGIVDFGGALRMVCEASQVDPSTICFSVQEENVIADQDMAELVAGIMNEGVGVVVKPVSSYDEASIIAEAAMHQAVFGNMNMLEAFINDDWDTLLDEASQASKAVSSYKTVGTKIKPFMNRAQRDIAMQNAELAATRKGIAQDISARSGQTQTNPGFIDPIQGKPRFTYGDNTVPEGQRTPIKVVGQNPSRKAVAQKAADDARSQQDKEAQLAAATALGVPGSPDAGAPKDPMPAVKKAAEEQIKKVDTDPKGVRNWIAKKIAVLSNWLNKFHTNLKNAGENAPWYKKMISYVTKAIQWLTDRMHNLFAKDGANFLDKRYDAA